MATHSATILDDRHDGLENREIRAPDTSPVMRYPVLLPVFSDDTQAHTEDLVEERSTRAYRDSETAPSSIAPYDVVVQHRGDQSDALDFDESCYTLTENYATGAKDSTDMSKSELPGTGNIEPCDKCGIPYYAPLVRRETRRVKLLKGQVYSADFPVPSAIQNSVHAQYRGDLENGLGEFTHMRYTAATCDPKHFTLANGYNLRPSMYHRHTELLIAITAYNEDQTMLNRTLHSVMQNIRDLCTKKSEFWNKGGPSWQKIVVCLLFDGIEPLDRSLIDSLATIGVYQDNLMKRDLDGKETVAHIFEYTTQLSVDPHLRLIRPSHDGSKMFPPVQIISCIKQYNSRKINSHRWLFTAFARILNPEIVVTLDIGTALAHGSLSALWSAFYNDKKLAGACGEVSVDLGRRMLSLLNPLVAAQHFEYKISYQLDRALEASFGCITVLPGAYSGYRYRAIIGRPLEKYFHGDQTMSDIIGTKGFADRGVMRRNMFLAEDRLICREVVNMAGSDWHLGYVKGARAHTDVPADIPEFLNQRRRWLNGAFASTYFFVTRFGHVYKSHQSFFRMALLHLQLLFNVVNFLLAWFSLAGYLLALFIVNEISGDPPPGAPVRAWPFGTTTPVFNSVLQVVYLSTIVFQFLLALGSRPRHQKLSYLISFVIFGVVQAYFLMNIIYLFKRVGDVRFGMANNGAKNYDYISLYYSDIGDLTVFITGIAFFGVYIAAGVLTLDPWHLFTSYAQYLFVTSSYTNILSIYAFSNIHDVSWGTKGQHRNNVAVQMTSAKSHKVAHGPSVIEEPEPAQQDIDTAFESVVKRALTRHVPQPKVSDVPTFAESSSSFRTRLIAVYIFSNFFLCFFVLNDSFKQLHWLGDAYWHKIWFFRIWLWANAGCLYFRFVGCCVDVIKQALYRLFARF